MSDKKDTFTPEELEIARKIRREYARQWYQNNREKAIAYSTAWQKKNADRVRAYKRAWSANNPKKMAEYQARYWLKKATKQKQEDQD